MKVFSQEENGAYSTQTNRITIDQLKQSLVSSR